MMIIRLILNLELCVAPLLHEMAKKQHKLLKPTQLENPAQRINVFVLFPATHGTDKLSRLYFLSESCVEISFEIA